MDSRIETPVREIQSCDGECFDEQVEKAVAACNRQARIQAAAAQRQQHNAVVGVPQLYHQNGQYSEDNFISNYEEDPLEAKLAAVVQTHLAYSQQAHNTVQSIFFEVIRQKDTMIAQLQAENHRLQHQHSFGSGGHNSGGTGESPPGGYSSPVKKAQVAWNSDDPKDSSLREAAREVKITAFHVGSNAPYAPMTGVGVVEYPRHDPPMMPKKAETSVSIHPAKHFEVGVVSASVVGVDQRPSQVSQASARPISAPRTEPVRRHSYMKAATQARLDAKENRDSEAKVEEKKKDGPTAVFIDANAMKEKVKEAVMRPEYNVMNFYKSSGCWQCIARSPWFENVTLGVIAFNALWIAVDTDKNKAATLIVAHPVFIAAENTFCCYFTLELLIRFMAFRIKRDCLRDAWFVFDSALVIMMVMETWVMSAVLLITDQGSGASLGDASILRLVRLLRLTRMARMARLLRAMPELMILIKGISVATRSVFFTLCLLTIIIYVFGVAFTQLSEDTSLEKKYFDTVPDAMNSLLLMGVLPDLAEFVNGVGKEHVAFGILLLFFILLSSLTVMNMLVGVLVEVVSVVSSVEKEQMTVQFVKTMIQSMLENSGLDADHDKHISRPEFESLLLKPEAARIIQEVGVDVVGLVDFADFIFKDGVELSFPEFMEIVLQLRGCNTATVRDIVDLRKFVLTEIHSAVASISVSLSEKVEDAMAIVAAKTNDNLVNAHVVSSNEPSNTPPMQPQVVETTLTDTSSSSKNFRGARYRGVKPTNYVAFNEQQNTHNNNKVGQYTNQQNTRPMMTRPCSGMSMIGLHRPRSGTSNPQPLPAFPDSMWITELEEVAPSSIVHAPSSNAQDRSQRRAGRIHQVNNL